MRQMHHWAALLFVAAIGLHMLRVFFTGAFRKPRELNWVIGFMLFILAMAEGFTGYSLPDDLLSGNGLRIIDGMVKGIPVIGTWTSFLLFGGEFPGTDDRRPPLHAAHPAAAGARRRAHRASTWCFVVVHKHTQFAGPGRDQRERRRPARSCRSTRRRPADSSSSSSVSIALIAALVHDQPDLELRPVRPLPGLGGYPARLVHRLRRRRPAPDPAGLGVRAGSTAPGRSTSSSRSS